MAQHDYNIANASGAAVRADINNALAAIKTSNSGASPPASPAAGMMWLDTDTPSASEWTLKIYDGADWIALGTINASTNIYTPASTATGAALIRAANAAAARTAIGATTTGSSLITAANAAAARTAIGATTTGSSLITAANAAAARTAIGATTTGSSLITAAGPIAARTALGATTTGSSLFTASDAAAARAAIGATATGSSLITATDAAAAQAIISAPTKPTTAGGAGNWSAINTTYEVVLPSGGTWAYFFLPFDTVTNTFILSPVVGVAAGGATVATANYSINYIGFQWRVA